MGLTIEQQREKRRKQKALEPHRSFSPRQKKINQKNKLSKKAKKHQKLARTNYRLYLRSNRWKAIKKRCLSSPRFKECSVVNCESTNIHLHHTRYDRLGTKKEITDLTPLCPKHHTQVHKLHKAYKSEMNLLQATLEIINQ